MSGLWWPPPDNGAVTDISLSGHWHQQENQVRLRYTDTQTTISVNTQARPGHAPVSGVCCLCPAARHVPMWGASLTSLIYPKNLSFSQIRDALFLNIIYENDGFWFLGTNQLSESDPLRLLLRFWVLTNISKSDPLRRRYWLCRSPTYNFLRCSLRSHVIQYTGNRLT